MTTPTEADDTICELLRDSWQAAGLALDKVEWPNVAVEGPKLFDGTDPWARLTIQLTGSRQTTMGPVGMRRFQREGLATVQVYVPAGERGLERARSLCMVALNAYEGISSGGVRFVLVEPKDVGPDGPWYQANVVASFEFEEVK